MTPKLAPCCVNQNKKRDSYARNRPALLPSTPLYRFLLPSTALHFGPHNKLDSDLVNSKMHFFQK